VLREQIAKTIAKRKQSLFEKSQASVQEARRPAPARPGLLPAFLRGFLACVPAWVSCLPIHVVSSLGRRAAGTQHDRHGGAAVADELWARTGAPRSNPSIAQERAGNRLSPRALCVLCEQAPPPMVSPRTRRLQRKHLPTGGAYKGNYGERVYEYGTTEFAERRQVKETMPSLAAPYSLHTAC
jgi:hypothetical protein